MQIKSITSGAAVLLALASSALAGTAHVVNNCGIPVYYASVAHGDGSTMQPMGGSYSESMAGSSSGVSIKLSTKPTGAVTQFEYNLSGGKLSYDMSNINGNPFASGGMVLTPSMQGDSSNPTCVPVSCPAGVSVCSAAYNAPNDIRTLVCNGAADLTLTLCPGGSMKRDESGAHLHRIHSRHILKR